MQRSWHSLNTLYTTGHGQAFRTITRQPPIGKLALSITRGHAQQFCVFGSYEHTPVPSVRNGHLALKMGY